MKHKHAEVIHAFADGKEIECRNLRRAHSYWGPWASDDTPDFDASADAIYEWRIKPPPPHKWQHVIDAHKAGKAVQFRVPVSLGVPDSPWTQWLDADRLLWPNDSATEYRIKPKTLRYRRYLAAIFKDVPYVATFNASYESLDVEVVETASEFIRWIDTEWQEVEVDA